MKQSGKEVKDLKSGNDSEGKDGKKQRQERAKKRYV
jgi:hypothetical protein